MAFKIKDGVRVGTVDVFNNSGSLLVNAPTATKLATARTINGVSFDGSANITITSQAAHALTIGTGLSGTSYDGSSAVTIAIDSTVATLTGTQTLTNKTIESSTISGSNNTISNIANSSLVNDSVTVNGETVALGASITVTAATNEALTIGEGLTLSSGTTFDGSTALTLVHANTSDITSIDNADGNVIQDLVFDAFGHVTGATSVDLDDRYYTETEADARFINVTGDTMTGYLTLNADPTQALHAATKEYVDNVAAGVKAAPSCRVKADSNLSGTYDNGTAGVGATLNLGPAATLTIDGISDWSQYDGVLVSGQTTAAENGRYFISQVGDGSTDWILTRCGFCDEASEIPGSYIFVNDGLTYTGTGWILLVSDPATFVVGTDAIIVTQFSGAGTYTAGSGLALNGNQFSHEDTSSQSSVDNSDGTVIQDITLDGFGHITAIGSANLDNRYYTETEVDTNFLGISDNAVSASKWANARTITLLGDLSGSVSIDGSGDVNLTATVTSDAVELGTNTTGNYVASITNGSYILGGDGGNEGATLTLAVDATSANTVSKVVARDALGNFAANTITADLSGNASTADAWSTARTITLAGDLSGNVSIDGSTDVTLTATITADAIALGTDTTGNYVAAISSGTGINVSGSGSEGATVTIGIDSTVATLTDTQTLTNKSLGDFNQKFSTTTIANQKVEQATVATTNATAVDVFDITVYRSAKYVVQVTQGSNYQVSEILVIHNGTTTYMTEYAVIETNGALATFSSDISGNDGRLLVTMGSANSATINIQRTAVVI